MRCYRGYSRRGIRAGDVLQKLLDGGPNVETGREYIPVLPQLREKNEETVSFIRCFC